MISVLALPQGPFAHIAAIACHKLWKLPVFKVIRSNNSMRRQVIAAGTSSVCAAFVVARFVSCAVAAAVASGTASVMGAPVGALIFSIEVTASFYLVRYTLPLRFASHVLAVTLRARAVTYGAASCAPLCACLRSPSCTLSRYAHPHYPTSVFHEY